MKRHLYASYSDAGLAERAAGALLDHGALEEDLSVLAPESHVPISVKQGRKEPSAETEGVEGQTSTSEEAGIMSFPRFSTSSGTLGTTGTMGSAGEPGDYGTSGAAGHTSDPNAAGRFTDPTGSIYRPEQATEEEVDVELDTAAKQGISLTTPADAAAGATTGAAVGLGVGAVAALASLIVPGFGLVMGGGALALAIAGATGSTLAGAAAGAVVGYLKDQGVPEEISEDYETVVRNGGAIVEIAVPSGGLDEQTAEMILTKYGATNIQAYDMAGS